MPVHKTSRDFLDGTLEAQPRVRVCRTAPLQLTTAWQRVDFSGESPLNVNTFPDANGNRAVRWDAAAKLIRFGTDVDRNYDTTLNIKTTSLSLLSLASLVTVSARLRYVVPAPTPIYFPLPEAGGYLDIMPVNLSATMTGSIGLTVYASKAIRDYGLGLELCLSAAPLGAVTVTAADLILYSR